MRANIVIQADHAPLAVLNQVDEHTGFWEGAVEIGKGIGYVVTTVYHGATGQWAACAEDVKKTYEFFAQGVDKLATRDSNMYFSKTGVVSEISHKVKIIMITFNAWSEDNIKSSAFGRVDPPTSVHDSGQQFYKGPHDVYHYFHRYQIFLESVPSGVYKFAFGACDDGWHYDIGVASTLTIGIDAIDKPEGGIDAPSRGIDIGEDLVSVLQSHARSGAGQPKHTGERPGTKVILPWAWEIIDEPPQQ